MGRLDVHIRHGNDGNGGVAAMVVIAVAVALAGAAWGAIVAAFHVILAALEVIAWTVAGAVMAAAAAGGVLAGLRVKHAVEQARARRTPAGPVLTITPGNRTHPAPAGGEPPAIEPPQPSAAWPLPGWWQEIRPRIGGDGNDTRDAR